MDKTAIFPLVVCVALAIGWTLYAVASAYCDEDNQRALLGFIWGLPMMLATTMSALGWLAYGTWLWWR